MPPAKLDACFHSVFGKVVADSQGTGLDHVNSPAVARRRSRRI
jgi:hypothetical protein